MALHNKTFDYLQPTPAQIEAMNGCRLAAQVYAECIDGAMPDGPDKTHAMRLLRTCATWVNIGITRQPDGAPRA